ncbi:MAG: carboxypeptidase regulatory-like domain-containing protein [Pirellulales bacterium]
MTLAAFAAWIVNYQALAAAVLLVATLAGLLVRQPARRAVLDWATIAGLLALAGLSALPGWPRVALFERPAALEQPEAQPPAPVLVNAERPSLPPREFASRFEPRAPRAAGQPVATPLTPPVAPPPKPAPWRWSDLAAPLASAYLAGMGLVVVWLLWGAVESWRLVRRATPPANDLLATLANLAEGKSPRLLVSGDVSAAAALGALRPTILVTPQLAAAPAEVVRAVLAHELAHLRHGDLWFLALGRTGLLLLYPQPLYWWLRRRAADGREALADAAAAGAADRTQYAELLVAAARTLSGPPRRGPALAILERPSQLGRRVKLLLDPRGAIELRSSRRWRWLGAAAAAVVVLAASLVQVMPAAVGQAEEKAAGNNDQKIASTAEAKPAAASQQDVAETPYRAVEPDAQGALTYSGVLVEHKSGKPIAGGTVIVKRLVSKGEDYQLLETTEHPTDKEGRFRFTIPQEQLLLRRLLLRVDAQHPQYAGRTMGGYGLSLIRKNEQFGSPPFYARIELLPGVEVKGVIEDPQGKPIPDLEVQYFSVDPNGGDPLFANSRSQGSVRTDANGRFTFNAIRGGDSTVWVAPSAAIAPGNLATKTLFLGKRTGDVGRVRLETGQQVAGRVLDADGAPLQNAWVHATPTAPRFFGSAEGSRDERNSQTNDRGDFTLDALPPGKYRVSVSDRNWGASVGNQPITPLRAVFKPQILELEDKPGATLEFKALPHFTLEAQWVDSSGQPTSGHSVMVTGKWDGEHYATQGVCDDKGHVVAVIPQGMTEVRFKTTTSEHSTFRLRRGKDGALLEGTELDLATPTEDVPDLFIVRYAAPIVVIRARDAAGRPIKDFRPRIDYRNAALRNDPRARWVTGVEGDVSLEQSPDGSWRSSHLRPDEEMSVRVAAPGFREASRELKLEEGKTEEVEFVLEPLAPGEAEPEGARARPQRPATYFSPRVYRPVQPDAEGALTYWAMVVDRETGMPVEGAKVVVKRYDYGGGSPRVTAESEATTDDLGEFSFTLPAEQVASPRMYLAFDIQHPGYVQQLFHGGELSAVRARERMGLAPEFQKLELAPGEPIFGQIVTPAGQPLAGLAVRYLTMSPNAHGSSEGVRTESQTTTDAEGRFRFSGVRGGLTRLWVEPADYAPRTLLLGKRTGDLGRIEVQEGQRLTGTLLDVDGRPVTNAWVRVGPKSYPFVQRAPGEQGQRTAKTDARGRFALAPLLPGEYQASVSGRDASNRESTKPESPLPAVFLTQLVNVGADQAANDVTLKAVPHVRVEVTRIDALGAPVGDERFDAFLHGKLGDVLVAGESHRDRPGHITILAPRGLREAKLELGLNREGTVSHRRGLQGELIADRSLDLGTLDQDIDDILVLHKKSPILIVQPINSAGRQVDKVSLRIDYPRGTLGAPESQRWPNGVEGQVMLGVQPDGRWRSEGLLPDQDFTLTLKLPDGQVVSRAFKLRDGQTEEVNIELPEVGPYLRVLEAELGAETGKPAKEGFRRVLDEGPMEEGATDSGKRGSEAQGGSTADDAPLYRAEIDFGPMEDESAEKTPQAGDGAAASEGRETERFRLVWDEGPMEEEGAQRATDQAQGQNGADAKSIEASSESNSRGWTYWGGAVGVLLSSAPPAGSPPRSITRPEDLPKGFTAYKRSDTLRGRKSLADTDELETQEEAPERAPRTFQIDAEPE